MKNLVLLTISLVLLAGCAVPVGGPFYSRGYHHVHGPRVVHFAHFSHFHR